MISNWVRGAPLRKLLAILITPVWMFVVFWSLKWGTDIPRNAHDLLSTMCAVIYGGYFGTSAWETASALKHRDRHRDERDEECEEEKNHVSEA